MLIPVVMVLDRALRDAGIPIDGVSVGDPLVRSTWRAAYSAGATATQRTQGDQLLATVDPQDATTIANIKADVAMSSVDADVLKAIVAWCAQKFGVTRAVARAEILAILKTLQ